MPEPGSPETREFHQKAYELFQTAVQLPDGQRTEFVEKRTEDPRLREEVLHLLRHDPGNLPDAIDAPENHLAPGSRLGNYEIKKLLGVGGMAEVYLAEQETPLKREVALKVVRPDLHTLSIITRFRFEERVLARMDHPGIAKVFDAGVSDEGRPYFALEYVPGVPLTDYCETHGLSLRKRLEIFGSVCRAVQHAHQKGIIHRDLKPANVLVYEVDGHPHAKIIDFGIAHAMGDAEGPRLTAHGVLVGTPEYMSPEQARGELVDTRADVYALGVILYEVLSGARPFELQEQRSGDSEELLRMVREEDPPPPSVRIKNQVRKGGDTASITTRMRRLQGELDWIVMKSLNKLPGERYQSPGELEADIKRYLEGDIVLARPPTTRYRVRKFLSRHRVLVGSTLAVVLLVLGFTAVLAWQFRVARSAELRAEREAEIAQDRLQSMTRLADDILTNVYEEIRDTPGLLEAKTTLAQSLARHLQSMEGEDAADPQLAASLGRAYLVLARLQADPRSQSIGDNTGGLENVENAIRHLETGNDADALLEAQILRANLLQSHGGVWIASEILESCLRSSADRGGAPPKHLGQAHLMLSDMSWELGRYESAARHARLAVEQFGMMKDGEGSLARALLQQASVTEPEEAMALADSAVHVAQAGRRRNPRSSSMEMGCAHALTVRGSFLFDAGRVGPALEDFTASLEIWDQLSENDPGDSRARNYAARNHHWIGKCLAAQGKVSEAEAQHLAGARLREEIRESEAKPTWGAWEWAYSQLDLARFYADTGDYGRALTHYENCMEERDHRNHLPETCLLNARISLETAAVAEKLGRADRELHYREVALRHCAFAFVGKSLPSAEDAGRRKVIGKTVESARAMIAALASGRISRSDVVQAAFFAADVLALAEHCPGSPEFKTDLDELDLELQKVREQASKQAETLSDAWIESLDRERVEEFDAGVLPAAWKPHTKCGEVGEVDGVLKLEKRAGCEGGVNVFLEGDEMVLHGDFMATVDFTLPNFPVPDSGVCLTGFQVRKKSDGSRVAVVERHYRKLGAFNPAEKCYKAFTADAQDSSPDVTWIPAISSSGKYRFSRRGNMLSLFVWNDGWIEAKSEESTGEDLFLVIYSFVNKNASETEVWYDNLRIRSKGAGAVGN